MPETRTETPAVPADDEHASAWSLLRERRFGAFFSTQFLGAFNDNVYKNALVGIFTYKLVSLGVAPEQSPQLINFAALIFMLPFFIFSSLAGQIAEKYEKAELIKRIKLFEILVMLVGAVGLLTNQLWLLLVVLFMMGSQSSFFGPIKYSILPQHLRNDELTGGNALVETGTFLAILLGTIAGGLLSAIPVYGNTIVAIVAIGLAIAGWAASRYIPPAAATEPDLKIKFNAFTESWRIIAHARKNRTVFLGIMGISWFWYFGAYVLNQVPSFAAESLSGDQTVVTALIATFSIGIGAGSMLCARWSGRAVEIGLVPLGAIGMTLFTLHLGVAPIMPGLPEKMNALQFLSYASNWRILFDLLGIAVSGGLYIVPLYSLIQTRGDRQHLSRTFAGLNIMNAFFIIAASLTAVGLIKGGVSTSQLFLVLATMHVVVAGYIFSRVPEFGIRLIAWVLVRVFYRLEEEDLHNIPLEGAAVLVSNHVTYVDALVIGTASRRPPKFVMYYKIYNSKFLKPIFKMGKTIPIAPAKEDRELLEDSYEKVHQALQDGDIVCIFPEGMLSKDGEIQEFKSGIEKIIARDPVPVIPVALRGFWPSMFSRKPGGFLSRFPGVLFKRVQIKVGEPIAPEDVTKELLFERVSELRGDWQ